MDRIESYEDLSYKIVNWIKDYYWDNNLGGLVVGVSGGIDSAVVSTLCAKTGLPTYILTMPLNSNKQNTELSLAHADFLKSKYPNVVHYDIDLSEPYHKLISTIGLNTAPSGFTTNQTLITDNLTNANTKSRMRMVTLYQIAGVVKGIVVGTGNKVEDYGVGFYTKYGDGGVDIAPIADLYKTEVWLLGEYLQVDERICQAPPTDGLWEDGRNDEDQIGATYEQLEEAMELQTGPAVDILKKFNTQNKHKMESIPTFKLEKV